MKRATSISYISLRAVTFLLILLWVPVTIDKFWNLGEFHSTLLNQPFPNWWAGILFWLLPTLELLVVVLLAWPRDIKLLHKGMQLSLIMMLGFTLYIAFGVMGFYSKQPCGCGSVIKNLSWEQHLWFNVFFLSTSAIGTWLSRPANTNTGFKSRSKRPKFFLQLKKCLLKTIRTPLSQLGLYKLRFAVFRRRP